MMTWILPVYSLWLRDMKDFIRRRGRVVGAIGQPFVIWIFLASGFQNSFGGTAMAGMDYGTYLFPGVVLLIALFAALFSTMSVIEDKKSGFMQGVLTSPAPRAAIVWGKLLAGATLALAQAVLFMVLLPWTDIRLSLSAVLLSVLVLACAGLLLTSLGLFFSWRMSSTQGFHAVMNLLLLPLWVLSGALFPVDGAAPWLASVMELNPLYYVTVLFQRMFFLDSGTGITGGPDTMTALGVFAATSLLMFTVTLRTVAKR